MLDGAGRDHEHAVGRVVAAEIAADLLRREGNDGLRRAEDRPAERLVAIGGLGEPVEDHVVGRVVGGVDLLQDDLLLALELFFLEGGLGQDIGKDIDGERHVVLQDAGIIGGRLGGGRGVDFAADILDFLGDLAGGAACRALEGHVLEQVGNAVLVCPSRCANLI